MRDTRYEIDMDTGMGIGMGMGKSMEDEKAKCIVSHKLVAGVVGSIPASIPVPCSTFFGARA